jgi:hypothetical protein
MWGDRAVERALGADESVRIKGEELSGVRARLVDYDPAYQFVTVRPGHTFRFYNSVSIAGGYLYVSSLLPGPGGWGDSCTQLTLLGEPVGGVSRPGEIVYATAGTPDGSIWSVVGRNPHHLVRRDSTGTETATFTMPGDIKSDIAWSDRRIWFYNPNVHVPEMMGIDIAASIEIGIAQIDTSFALSVNGAYGLAIVDTIGYAMGLSSLTEFTMSGTVLRSWALPVSPVGGMAWDGEALWILHAGPPDARTDAVLLSRFRLP